MAIDGIGFSYRDFISAWWNVCEVASEDSRRARRFPSSLDLGGFQDDQSRRTSKEVDLTRLHAVFYFSRTSLNFTNNDTTGVTEITAKYICLQNPRMAETTYHCISNHHHHGLRGADV